MSNSPQVSTVNITGLPVIAIPYDVDINQYSCWGAVLVWITWVKIDTN
jgi:hypothetical protein